MTLSPKDFEFDLLNEAHRLRLSCLNCSAQTDLDPRTSMWVIRQDAWRELFRSRDFLTVVQCAPQGRKELLGLPVRVTLDDEPDVPMIQLVMEPLIVSR